jgi:pimeloyl-ACP methyl ester carboxylesterase
MIEETRATYDGVDTRVLSVAGDGTPIVLFHGYGDSADTWRAVLNGLEASGRGAVAVDLPGFGKAGLRRPGPLLPQFDAFADALLERTGPAVLVGNSLGAATAVRAANRNPDSVRALVTLDDPLGVDSWLARLARKRDVSSRVWNGVGRMPVPRSALLWAASRNLRAMYGAGKAVDPDVEAHWTGNFASPASLATLGRYAFQYARETSGGHVDLRILCPTVVVHGARDRIIPVDVSRRLHQQIPGSRLVVLPCSGHCPQLDDPDAVVGLLITTAESA